MRLTVEGGGYVLACECSWERWFVSRPDVETGRAEHARKCKHRKEGD